jgi:uncharacterized membrane protein HdeD (DUF308 family)
MDPKVRRKDVAPSPLWVDEVVANRGWFTALGIALILLGAAAIFMPFIAALVTTVFLGWVLLIGGIVQAVHAVQNRRWTGFGWGLAAGALYAVAGVILIVSPVAGTIGLTLALAAFFVADGVIKIVRAIQHRSSATWGWLLFDGVVTLVLGLLILARWPSTAVWAIGLLVGIDLIFGGMSMVRLASASRSLYRARM